MRQIPRPERPIDLTASAATVQKRGMRLGTRSCLECRRRKVRCVFDGRDRSCRQCILHDTVCRGQGSKIVNAYEIKDETQKLGQSPHTSDETIQLLLRALKGPSETPENSSTGKTLPCPALNNEKITHRSSSAPFLEFLRKALPIEPSFSPEEAERILPSVSSRNTSIPTCPNIATLVKIFQCTEAFWTVWPLAVTASKDRLSGFPGSVVDAITFVYKSLHSVNPGEIAKCLVWLTLCFLQLPKSFAATNATQLPLPKSELVDLYLRHATALINEFLDSGSDSLSGVEALAVQYKCLIDLGRPQQAWKCVRRGIDHALILGLDRVEGDSPNNRYRQLLWSTLWGGDRKMALFLGLPYTVPEHFLAAHDGFHSTPEEGKVLHKLNLICGHIIDRNRSLNSPYSETARIAEEMDELKAETPDAWWDLDQTDSILPLAILFRRRATAFIFHFTAQLLHLPHMLQARYDDRYRYSRTTVLSSAEVMLNTWHRFPCYNDVPIACDYLDFCAFNAAVILAADLVSSESPTSAEEEKRRWGLIMSTADLMQCKADILDCTVPAQSAQVLKTLHAARHGLYDASETYEVFIPYFGKISIKQIPAATPRNTADCFGAVDASSAFNFDFDPSAFGFRMPTELDPLLELGVDWSLVSQIWASGSTGDQDNFSQQLTS